jgi:hypothetical protein
MDCRAMPQDLMGEVKTRENQEKSGKIRNND